MKREVQTAIGTMVVDGAPNASENSLAVYLNEVERTARIGTSIPSSVALELISVLRMYMAHEVEARAKIDTMLERLK